MFEREWAVVHRLMNQLLVIILDLLNHVTDVNPVEALHKKVMALNPLTKGPFAIPYFRVIGSNNGMSI